jgi:adenylate kinase
MTDTLLTPEHLAVIKSWLKTGSINIFGLPFAGKDTHGGTLAELLDAPLIGGGEILRSVTLTPELQKTYDAGILTPQEDYLRIVTPYLSKEEFKGKPLILSSVGRWIGEEEGVLKAAEISGHPIKAVIYLHLATEVVHKRWTKSQQKGDRGDRSDDAEHVLDTRIQEFEQKTLPVIEEYRRKGMLIEVNSDAEKHQVIECLLARLLVLASKNS